METCCDLPQITAAPISPPPTTKRVGCGQHYPNGKAFQMVGNHQNESQYAEFPWMVRILQEQTFPGTSKPIQSFRCGGTLINSKVVVTAAHCLTEKKKIIIRVGEWDTRNEKELWPTQDREAESIIIHHNFFAPASFNDIALIVLTTPVNIAENVDVACLPSQGTIFDYANCFSTGWGKTSSNQHSRFANILKKINLPIVPSNSCQDTLRTTILGSFFNLDKSFICAGGKASENTCIGDGGGPLVCPVLGKKDTYQLAGIVSWGLACEDPVPGVYTNVAIFREWIDNVMLAQGLNTSSYQVV